MVLGTPSDAGRNSRIKRLEGEKNTNLAGVNVGAPLVDLRVVERKNGGVQCVRSSDAVAAIAVQDGVGAVAIFIGVLGKAEGLAWEQVGACGVNSVAVQDSELVSTGAYVRYDRKRCRYQRVQAHLFDPFQQYPNIKSG
jgi:hypothetical protein